MTKRLIRCALGGLGLLLIFWALAHASGPSVDDFCCILWIGDSLKDIVKDSEQRAGRGVDPAGGETGDRNDREIPPAAPGSTKEGDSHPPNEGEGNSTPPRAPDAGGPGRVVPPLSAWLFGIFDAQGRLVGAGTNKTAEECEAQLTEDRRTHDGYLFSPCVEIRAEREVI